MKINEIEIASVSRTKRKTISIKINENADVFVCAPQYISNHQLNRFLLTKYDWIKKKRNEILKSLNEYSHNYEEGDIFYFLGEEYKLKYNSKYYIRIDEKDKTIDLYPDCDIPYIIKRFYHKLSQRYLIEIAHNVSKKLNLYPKQYKISSAERRWGSCSSSGNINLSYKLLMCPPKFIEYVVIHEIAHLKEHNHSKRFWDYVEELMPDYKTQLQWIKENQYKLKL